MNARNIKHSRIFNRLNVIGISMKDLHQAINDRQEAEGKPLCNYTALSRALNGGREPKSLEVVKLADSITAKWMREYATEMVRVLTPRLKKLGVPMADLNGSAVPTEDYDTIIIVRSGKMPIATYRPTTNQIGVLYDADI